MKTTATILKHGFLVLMMALSLTACKKDKKGDPTPTPIEVKSIKLTDLKALITGTTAKVPDNTKITGIVISDVSNKNIDAKTVILQDAATQTGIIITFNAVQTFALGDQVEVNISGQTLAQMNGEIILQNVPAANAKKTGTGTIIAKSATAAEITTNKAAWDGTLVSIASDDLALNGGSGKYSGTLTIANSTGSLTSAILTGASFENTAYPVSVSSITGIVRTSGTDIRVDIRKTADVVTGAITRLITEDWTNLTPADLNYPARPEDFGGTTFTTAAASWSAHGNNVLAFYPGSKYDASFTASGKSYIYMGMGLTSTGTYVQGISISNSSTNLVGLKQVSVTFAGSNVNGDQTFPIIGDLYRVEPFNPATDDFQIAITPAQGDYPLSGSNNAIIDPFTTDAAILALIKTSAKYTQTGQFYTVTWTVPTKEQLAAAGVNDAIITSWLANPNFRIYNLSTRTADSHFGDPGSGPIAPVLIDKVIFGF